MVLPGGVGLCPLPVEYAVSRVLSRGPWRWLGAESVTLGRQVGAPSHSPEGRRGAAEMLGPPRGMTVGAAPRVPSSGAPLSLVLAGRLHAVLSTLVFSFFSLVAPLGPPAAHGLPMLLLEGFSHHPTTCGILVP